MRTLSNAIEREVLKLNKRLISKPYRKHMRRLTLRLRRDNHLGRKVFQFCLLSAFSVESIIAGEMDPAQAAQETFESSSNAESVGRLLYNENKLDPDLKKG